MKQMDTLLFQHGQSIDEIKNRLNCIETGSGSGSGSGSGHGFASGDGSNEAGGVSKTELMSDPEFVNGIVDNIMTNSNLSDIIEQIDAVQSENRELKELMYTQQKTINEMNIMLLKLFSQSVVAAPNPVAVPTPVPTPLPTTVAAPIQEAEEEEEAEAVTDTVAEEEAVAETIAEAEEAEEEEEAEADA
jgi:hypothetical protein